MICMLLWAGILEVRMAVYHWPEQLEIASRAMLLSLGMPRKPNSKARVEQTQEGFLLMTDWNSG
jgi:hypothetical protein